MEVLCALEEKVKALIAVAKKLKAENGLLQPENSYLKKENSELIAENARLAEGNAQLTAQLKAIEHTVLVETGQVHELKEERSMTRSVLDDLLRSIDSIVENEN
jgi:FtsZ-binding cell division protein ZapB